MRLRTGLLFLDSRADRATPTCSGRKGGDQARPREDEGYPRGLRQRRLGEAPKGASSSSTSGDPVRLGRGFGRFRRAQNDGFPNFPLAGLRNQPFANVFTAFENHYPIADLEDIVHAVRNYDLRDPVPLQLDHGFQHAAGRRGRKIRCRLVKNDDLGIKGDRARDRDQVAARRKGFLLSDAPNSHQLSSD